MTDKEKKELKDGVISIFKRFNILDHTATIGSLRDDILRYINSLSEEPVSEDLEQAAEDYADKHPTCGLAKTSFIIGAQWQKEQLMTKAIDGEVGYWNLRGLSINTDLPRSVSEGDVVKIITIKED